MCARLQDGWAHRFALLRSVGADAACGADKVSSSHPWPFQEDI